MGRWKGKNTGRLWAGNCSELWGSYPWVTLKQAPILAGLRSHNCALPNGMEANKNIKLEVQSDGTNTLRFGGYESGPLYRGAKGGYTLKDGSLAFSVTCHPPKRSFQWVRDMLGQESGPHTVSFAAVRLRCEGALKSGMTFQYINENNGHDDGESPQAYGYFEFHTTPSKLTLEVLEVKEDGLARFSLQVEHEESDNYEAPVKKEESTGIFELARVSYKDLWIPS